MIQPLLKIEAKTPANAAVFQTQRIATNMKIKRPACPLGHQNTG
jgi:hypothetical protein